MSPQLFTLDWASSIKDGHSHKLDGEAGERGGVLFSREKRGRVLLVAEEACFYCQEEESTDVKRVLLGELMLSSFELGV